MSADNYLWVDLKDGDEGKFRVSMQFASGDPYFRGDEDVYDTLADALEAAAEWEIREVIVEYGISVDPRCFDHQFAKEIDELHNRQEAMEEYLMDCGS